jgi:hypothetical protein
MYVRILRRIKKKIKSNLIQENKRPYKIIKTGSGSRTVGKVKEAKLV